ncbi:thiolase family protein [Paraburkholderia phymatum]|uniref:thiolase family protein n=1 Tax=Paraburkholderia phymatum TaxID=148447 RepID=UPI00317BA7E5
MSSATDIVVISGVRTPIGSFGGSLREVPAYDLGALAIRAAVARAGIEAARIDKVIYANCRQAGNGPNPARTAAVRGGIALSVPVFTVNMACPSGMKSLMLAARELASGDAQFVVAGGMESMSTMPYLLHNARWEGFKSGDKVLKDSWSDTVDPLCGYGMGITAENQAEKHGISREAQDEFALLSQRRAAAALKEKLFADEIVPVKLEPSRKNPDGAEFGVDEGGRPDSSLQRLALLKPVFKPDGTVTAGNACTMGDAACALVLTTRARAMEAGLKPMFSILAFAETAVEPALMGDGPSLSIPLALERANLTLADMDFIEVNEAFAAQILANERALNWNREKVNVFGGAIALGHPTGVSGARLPITLNNVLRRHDKEFGVAAICGGGGVTTAMVIRREN